MRAKVRLARMKYHPGQKGMVFSNEALADLVEKAEGLQIRDLRDCKTDVQRARAPVVGAVISAWKARGIAMAEVRLDPHAGVKAGTFLNIRADGIATGRMLEQLTNVVCFELVDDRPPGDGKVLSLTAGSVPEIG